VLSPEDLKTSSFRANMQGKHHKFLLHWAKMHALKRGKTGALEDILDRMIDRLYQQGKVEFDHEDEDATGTNGQTGDSGGHE